MNNEFDFEGVPRGMGRPHDPSAGPTFVRGKGVWLWDSEGKDYIDFTSSYSSLNFGHAHPELVRVAQEQLATLAHITGAPTPWRNELCRKLAEIAPLQKPLQTWLCTTGARAVETAWKIAFARKPGKIVSFDQGFHGRSISTSLISQTARLPLLDSCSDSIAENSLAFPQCSNCKYGEQPESCRIPCFESIEKKLRAQSDEISAVIIEPAIGARGYLFAPDRFFHRLRDITRELDILLIADEIQTGLGRLGGRFASETQSWQPDLTVIGKSLGGGLVPISAVIGSRSLMDLLEPGIESETFAGDPLGCRIALQVLSMLDQELLARVSFIGDVLRQRLGKFAATSEVRVDGIGCTAVLEFSPNKPTQGKMKAAEFTRQARDAGVLVHQTGPERNRVVFLPPFIISDFEIDQAMERLRPVFAVG